MRFVSGMDICPLRRWRLMLLLLRYMRAENVIATNGEAFTLFRMCGLTRSMRTEMTAS